MTKRNALLDRERRLIDAAFKLGQAWGRQAQWDATQIALNREYGFGAERLTRLNDAAGDVYAEIVRGFERRADADVYRAHIDGVLAEIYGGKAQPWEVRYDGWKDDGVEREQRWKE